MWMIEPLPYSAENSPLKTLWEKDFLLFPHCFLLFFSIYQRSIFIVLFILCKGIHFRHVKNFIVWQSVNYKLFTLQIKNLNQVDDF